MRVLITGARGFVAPLVAQALREAHGRSVELVGASRDGDAPQDFDRAVALDVTSPERCEALIAAERPEAVVHLAGVAAPREASADPRAAWRVNVEGTLDLARAVLSCAPRARFVFAGSGAVYGDTALAGRPLDEEATLRPVDDYASTKAAADLALGAMAKRGLDVVRMRPFNHTGPGQSEAFVAPAFAMQIARIEAGLTPSTMMVGDLDAERDFLDARDVAHAYGLAADPALRLAPGEILNLCSGAPLRVGGLLERLLALSPARVDVEVDPARLRPGDPRLVVGDPSKAARLLGWAPRHAFGDTLRDLMEDCRRRVAQSRPLADVRL
jgi:GDP-4-dehydro-6-deoxy-D-mannose reductase